MRKLILLTFLSLLLGSQAFAGNPDGNPFKRLGHKVNIATFGDGEEFHDQERIVVIGTALYDTEKKEVVGFIDEDQEEDLAELIPEVIITTIDPHCERYYSISPYVYCMNNPINLIDPDGRDWYRFQDDNGEWQYEWSDQIHSQKALNKVKENAEYLGRTYTNEGTYYSLFGSQIEANSFEGKIYELVDQAIIKEAEFKIAIKSYTGREDISSPKVDFSIEGMTAKDSRFLGLDSHRNEYPINYEGSFRGLYRIASGKGLMKGYMEEWIGKSDMPKEIGGWSRTQKAYHIIFRNSGNYDIIHLMYDKPSAQLMLNKYYNLFPQLNK